MTLKTWPKEDESAHTLLEDEEPGPHMRISHRHQRHSGLTIRRLAFVAGAVLILFLFYSISSSWRKDVTKPVPQGDDSKSAAVEEESVDVEQEPDAAAQAQPPALPDTESDKRQPKVQPVPTTTTEATTAKTEGNNKNINVKEKEKPGNDVSKEMPKEFLPVHQDASNKPSFKVQGNFFNKDGQKFRYQAGTAHYWRRMPEYWEDTIVKLKALGLNALETYISWNLHEPEPETYDFEGGLDFIKYFQLAQKHGLLVIVRPGPFINAEADMGGLPYWLLRENAKMQLRTNDPAYFKYVERWYNKLLPMLKDLLYSNGGPIIMVQIENEYGSYFACDQDYMSNLFNLTRKLLGPDVVLYTTDGYKPRMLQCGPTSGAVATVDFGAGANVTEMERVFRKYVPDGPFVNSEFYPGWINHWGRPWNIVPVKLVLSTMRDLLLKNASFTFYPVMGGTNFGFTVGPNFYNEGFTPGTTSYDFDSPLSEAGDPTDKYWKIRDVFKEFGIVGAALDPVVSEKGAYGVVNMEYRGTVFDNLINLGPSSSKQSDTPLTFEEMKHPYGFMLYRTIVKEDIYSDPTLLDVQEIHDRAHVFVDQKPVGILSRQTGLSQLNIMVQINQTLDILVHNEGRITAGPFINDSKGIIGDVKLFNHSLTNWQHFPLTLPSYPVKNPLPLKLQTAAAADNSSSFTPSFYEGKFKSEPALDTFLSLDGWHHGYAFVNGYNLGRYWPAEGPQLTLYIPGAMLKTSGENILQLFELDKSPCLSTGKCFVKLVDKPSVSRTKVYIPKL